MNKSAAPLILQYPSYLLLKGFVRVLEDLESPGILLWHFPGLEKG